MLSDKIEYVDHVCRACGIIVTHVVKGLWMPSLPLIEVKKDPDPMPLIGPNSPPLYPPIPDPWSGWIGTDQFGPGCLPWVRLEVWTRHQPYTQDERATLQELNAFWTKNHELLVVSGFQWTGGHFRPAPPQTQRWWNRIRGWVDRNAVKLRSGLNFWAFPSALEKLKSGMRYYSRNFDLDDAIQHAENLDQRK